MYLTDNGKQVNMVMGFGDSTGIVGAPTHSLDEIKDMVNSGSSFKEISEKAALENGLVSPDNISDRTVESFAWYAMSDARFYDLNNDVQYLIRDLMSYNLSDTNMREKIVCYVLGYKHLPELHGYDAEDSTGMSIEIKSESNVTNGLAGKSSWGLKKYESLKKLSKDNPTICMAGFAYGKLQYTATFKYNDTELYGQMLTNLKSQLENKKTTTVKAQYGDWGNAKGDKINIKFYPGYNSDFLTKPFANFLEINK
jgi:hypothetical protein|tara:strand:+ start:65 stop:826 length:762 start_codon:yes stop_codon:yes gene_type:complete